MGAQPVEAESSLRGNTELAASVTIRLDTRADRTSLVGTRFVHAGPTTAGPLTWPSFGVHSFG